MTDPAHTPLLFVDLDGTVRHGYDQLGRFVNTADDVHVFPEALEQLARWRLVGGRVAAVTNQGGIALGHVTTEAVEAALAETQHQCGGRLDVIEFCPHYPARTRPDCACRKPKAGMLLAAHGKLLAAHPGETYPPELCLMVGDRPEDAAAAKAFGIRFLDAADWRAGKYQLRARAGGWGEGVRFEVSVG